MNARFKLGLTGGIGSGKSTVADMFADLGATLVDTDLIAHQLTAPGGLAISAISQEFGSNYITAEGAMDRAKMRETVFQNTEAKLRLEAILHPLIWQESQRQAELAQGSYLIYVVPLLVESGKWKDRVDRVLVVDCPEELQIQRVMQRNALSQAQVQAIMQHQANRAERLAAADDVILNDGPRDQIRAQVGQLHQRYSQLNQAR